jgi:NADH dehydrogenase
VLLLTGATGTVGRALLRRLLAAGATVRCLVRDPRRLGGERVRAQVALGDLGDPTSFGRALHGVDTVVHLAGVIRDQPTGSIEELVAVATARLLEAAEHAGARRFVFFSTLAADRESSVRFMRAKAIAEQAVVQSALSSTVFAPSIIYAPDDPYVTLLRRMSLLPVMPIPGDGTARFAPIWSEDVAGCVLATLPGGPAESESIGARYELAGPDVLTHRQIVALVLAAGHRRRRIVGIPPGVTRRVLEAVERVSGGHAFATWDEAELLDVSLLAAQGAADCRRLGVQPQSMTAVLGVEPRSIAAVLGA